MSGLLEVLVDLPLPLGAGLDAAVVPAADDPLRLNRLRWVSSFSRRASSLCEYE